MELSVKVFGSVSEKIGETEVAMENPGNVAALKDRLHAIYPQIQGLKFAIAINRQLATATDAIPEGAEIALLPPFSGG